MGDNESIEHEGIVKEIRDGKVKVGFVAKSACAHCSISGYCSAADMKDKEIEAPYPGKQIKVGDAVQVVMARSLGLRAVLLGYIIPFILVIVTLFIATSLTENELISGLISLGILVPWYLGLILARASISKQFHFSIRKTV